MKLFTILGTATVPLALGTMLDEDPNPNCKLSDLGEPEFFNGWNCVLGAGGNGSKDGMAYPWAKCYLACIDGYFPVFLQPREFHRCTSKGWQRPDSYDFRCMRNLDDLETEIRGLVGDLDKDLHKNFRDTMNFNAIQRLDNMWLDQLVDVTDISGNIVSTRGNVIAKINADGTGYVNGNVCDTDGPMDKHTADLMCQYMGYKDALQWKGSGAYCQESHPYAYNGGTHCCATKKEKTYAPQGAACDGGILGRDSKCCENDDAVACVHGIGQCYDRPNVEGNPNNEPIVVADISCPSTETSFPGVCTSSGWGRNGCTDDNNLWLECNRL